MTKDRLDKNTDLITTLSKLHRIESSDGQDYVQMYDVLETVRRYYAEKTAEWKIVGKTTFHYECSICGGAGDKWDKFCKHCGAKMKESEV